MMYHSMFYVLSQEKETWEEMHIFIWIEYGEGINLGEGDECHHELA